MRWPIVLLVICTACGDDDAMMMSGADAGMGIDAAPMAGDPTAADFIALLGACNVIGGKYANGGGEPANIDICGLTNAVFWKADLDVDCDGKMTPECSLTTDPDYQNQTAATDSHGAALDAAMLPYVVVPGVSTRWSYRTSGLAMGSVVAVIYRDKVAYGVLGDVGPVSYIGEASYAMADNLGIDPDPSTGGTDEVVAYVAFTGADAKVQPIEDHGAAVALGIAKAKILLGQ